VGRTETAVRPGDLPRTVQRSSDLDISVDDDRHEAVQEETSVEALSVEGKREFDPLLAAER
jgi:hypothetical protein